MEYELLDCGGGRKLERFGEVTLVRPAAGALWAPQLTQEWTQADGCYERPDGWTGGKRLPQQWQIQLAGLTLQLKRTEFGHLGLFPEHHLFWKWIEEQCASRKGAKVLNLFAYSGGATLAAARGGAHVCHLDAAQGMVNWARENAALSGLEKAPIRWIVDDAVKFLRRCLKRGERYQGIILDPPSFGRGAQGQVFKIEEHLPELLEACRQLLAEDPLFFLMTTHTAGLSGKALQQVLRPFPFEVEVGEMCLEGRGSLLPCGYFAKWGAWKP